MGSLVDNRPAKRGPSLGQCRGRWTQRQNRWGDHRRKRVIRTAGTRRRDSEPGHWVMPKVARYQERHRDRKRKAGRKVGGAGKESAARQSSTTLSVLLIPKAASWPPFSIFVRARFRPYAKVAIVRSPGTASSCSGSSIPPMIDRHSIGCPRRMLTPQCRFWAATMKPTSFTCRDLGALTRNAPRQTYAKAP